MSARILVVDDNPLNVKLLVAKLARDYYVVSVANNGLEGLEKAQQDKPDLILLDVMMPELNGFEVCQRLKSDPATAHIPVVMITALTEVTDRVKGLEAGADDFLNKPINDLALMARVRSLLRLKLIMDEWRLREGTAAELALPIGSEGGGHLRVPPAKVLLVEDDPREADLIGSCCANENYQLSTEATIAAALENSQNSDHDIVTVSLDLKEEDGLMLVAHLRADERTRTLPIIMLADLQQMERIAKGLDLGANDYLVRPLEPSEFSARSRSLIRQKRHYDQLRKNYTQSLSLALVDPLTGAYNRRYLETHLPRMLQRSVADGRHLSLLYVDADRFSVINNTYDHDNGDVVLKEIVARMNRSLRPTDLIVRLGGEEFAVIMPETATSIAQSVAERLRENVEKQPVLLNNGIQLTVTVSIGVASLRLPQGETMEQLIKRADQAMFAAKNAGRNRVVTDHAELCI